MNVKRKGRKRRIVGWWLIGCGALLVAVWVFSAVVGWSQRFGSCEVHVSCGVVVVRQKSAPMVSGSAPVAVVQAMIAQRSVDRELDFLRYGQVELWWWRVRTGSAWYVGMPIWGLAVASVAAGFGLFAWGWDGRRKGVCASCGYDLRGLGAGAVCPECGRGTT